jgi:hypothetical protein
VGYSPVNTSECTPGSVQIEGASFKSERKNETDPDYPKGCYTIEAGDGPYHMYWNASTTSRAKDRGWDGYWDSLRRLCKKGEPTPTRLDAHAFGGRDGCPVAYRPLSEEECSLESVPRIGSVSFMDKGTESDGQYPLGCYAITTIDKPKMYWNSATTTTAKERDDGLWASVKRLCTLAAP